MKLKNVYYHAIIIEIPIPLIGVKVPGRLIGLMIFNISPTNYITVRQYIRRRGRREEAYFAYVYTGIPSTLVSLWYYQAIDHQS